MTWTIDHLIFFGFLALNVVFGLMSSRGITTIRQYALGDRNFSTSSIVATLVATWISGGTVSWVIIESYNQGLYYILCELGTLVYFLIMGYFFIPRMSEFLGKLSIADTMGDLYGNKIRLITALSGFIGVLGFVSIQLKISGIVFEYILNIPSIYGVIFAGIVITLYSSLGGIKSVTFTDMIQFFTFGTIIPLITTYLFHSFTDIDTILNIFKTHPNYDLKEIFNISNSKSWSSLSLFFYIMIPCFSPVYFQRFSMSKNIRQAQRSFYIAGFFCLFIVFTVIWLAIVIYAKNPNVPSSDIVKTLIFDVLPSGYKGFFLIGIIAMIMSTADSYINSSAVLVTYDFCKSLKINLKNELTTARIVSFIIGILSILLALKEMSLLKFSIFVASFYMPIVTVPFIMAVIGYRTPYEKAVLWGMGAGLSVVLLWNYLGITVIDNIVPAMLANLFVLVFMHYYYHNQFLKG
jgi:Na+/proline symporter